MGARESFGKKGRATTTTSIIMSEMLSSARKSRIKSEKQLGASRKQLVCQRILFWDLFAQNFSMKLDHGMLGLPTAMGLFYSFLLVCLLLGYSLSRLQMLIGTKNVDILTATNHEVYHASKY